ncbi:hypothetical protein [Candidatus Hepatoplasma crinochetorum]|uniref:hypothetical protein n=1 Tax=Candidatus Hepatoplasma crinochetorum TaxID=295596 RepID=UPI00308DE84D|nr:MAG: hypothetical protein HCTKY_5300 [Candidatus Hepatoplasma crinochetorum]
MEEKTEDIINNKIKIYFSGWEIESIENSDQKNDIFKLSNNKTKYFLKFVKNNHKDIYFSKDGKKYQLLSDEISLIDEAIGTIKEFINDYDPNLNDKYLGVWKKLHEYNPSFIEGMTTLQTISGQTNIVTNGAVKGHTHRLADRYVGSRNKSEGINDNSDVVGFIDGYDAEGNIIRIGQSHDEVGNLIPYSLSNSSEENNFAAGLLTIKWVRIE